MVGTATVLHPRPQPRHQSSEFNSTRIDGHWRHPRNSGHDGSVTTSHIRPTMSTTISLDEEVRLYSTNAEREKYSTLATLFGIIIALDYLERAYVRDSITSAEYVSSSLFLSVFVLSDFNIWRDIRQHVRDYYRSTRLCWNFWDLMSPVSMNLWRRIE